VLDDSRICHPLVRFYGVWASHSRWRSKVVPTTANTKRCTCSDPSGPLVAPAGAEGVTIGEGEKAPPLTPSAVPSTSETQRTRSELQQASVAALPRAEASPRAPLHGAAEQLRFTSPSRLAWARLYQRVFDIDPLECSNCGGLMRFVEVIEDVGKAQ